MHVVMFERKYIANTHYVLAAKSQTGRNLGNNETTGPSCTVPFMCRDFDMKTH